MPLSFPHDHAVATSLPPGDLIGREHELTTLLGLLQRREDHLITVTGPGGVGKTRLVLEAADRSRKSSAFDQVAVIALAALSDPTLLLGTIATWLSVAEIPDRPTREMLIDTLTGQRWLLVLDNCEHLPTIGIVVADLLTDCPDLVVLATSRAPLDVYGEREFPLTPFVVPDVSQRLRPDELMRQPAVALFLRQAWLVDPTLELDDVNAVAIAEICRQLDGLPLAIELAAARVRVLPPLALLARLDQRLTVLTGGPRHRPPRQQTLSGAIAWSYDLLTESEQYLFRRLAIFSGGWTLPAAEAVAGETGADVLGGIETLTRHSLIYRRPHPAHLPSFAMLESLRAFGLDRLSAHDELLATRDRHAQYVIHLASDAERDLLLGNRQDHWLAALDWEIDNLRSSLTWLFEQDDIARGLRLAGALWSYWELRGHWVEGRSWLDRAMSMANVAVPDVRVRLLLGTGVFALRQGDYTLASDRLEESFTLARRLGDRQLTALSLFVLGNLARERPEPDYTLALSRFETALTMFRGLGQHYWVARIITNLGNVALAQGDAVRAAAYFEESLVLNRDLGSAWGVASALGNLAVSLVAQGEVLRAEGIVRESLTMSQVLGSRHMQSDALETLARIALEQGQLEQAVRLWGAAESVRDGLCKALPAPDRDVRVQSMNTARRHLGDASFETAWDAGYAAAHANSVEELFGERETSAVLSTSAVVTNAGTTAPTDSLSPREREILRLLVDGLSNQEIGAALFISPHTVAKHVANILAKLGVESRTAAATHALRQGLIDT